MFVLGIIQPVVLQLQPVMCMFMTCDVLACRYYFYAGTPDGALFLVEMIVATESRQASVTIKTEATHLLNQFVELWSNCLTGFYR